MSLPKDSYSVMEYLTETRIEEINEGLSKLISSAVNSAKTTYASSVLFSRNISPKSIEFAVSNVYVSEGVSTVVFSEIPETLIECLESVSYFFLNLYIKLPPEKARILEPHIIILSRDCLNRRSLTPEFINKIISVARDWYVVGSFVPCNTTVFTIRSGSGSGGSGNVMMNGISVEDYEKNHPCEDNIPRHLCEAKTRYEMISGFLDELALFLRQEGKFAIPNCLCNQKWSEDFPFHNIVYFTTWAQCIPNLELEQSSLEKVVVTDASIPKAPKWRIVSKTENGMYATTFAVSLSHFGLKDLHLMKIIKYAPDCEEHYSFQENVFREISNCVKAYCLGVSPKVEAYYVGKFYAIVIFEKLGQTLKTIFSLPMLSSDIFRIAKAIVEKIKILHENGIVHGDLHMDNIMFSENPVGVKVPTFVEDLEKNVKFVDFGFSFTEDVVTTDQARVEGFLEDSCVMERLRKIGCVFKDGHVQNLFDVLKFYDFVSVSIIFRQEFNSLSHIIEQEKEINKKCPNLIVGSIYPE
jgi:Protein kinase domain